MAKSKDSMARATLLRVVMVLATVVTAVLATGRWFSKSGNHVPQPATPAAFLSVATQPSGIVILNGARLNFDQQLDLSALQGLGSLTVYDATSREEALDRIEGQVVVVTKEMPLDADLISQFPSSVRLICEAGTGYNNIDLAAAKAKGITVCNVPAYSTDAVAQLVITYILNHSCSLIEQQRLLWQGDRSSFTSFLALPHFELNGKTLGLVGGSGAIGSKVTDIALALGMKVLISSRSKKTDPRPEVEYVSFDDLLRRSDFISLHCPLTPETKGLINAAALKQMKPSAYLINTARGPIIKEDDLIAALQAGIISGAALDVQDPEPPRPDSPLWELKNVILTPHIGWKRLESRQRLMNTVASNVAAFLQGNPVNVVN